MLAKLWKRQTNQVVGIDIGSHQVKAVLLEQVTDGFKLKAVASAPVKKGALNGHDIRDSQAIVESLHVISEQLPQQIKYAAVAVSGSSVITRSIYMDASLSEAEMEAQIEIEADNLIPYSLDEVSIDFETQRVNKSDPSKVDVLLTACRTEMVDARVDALDEIELEAKIVDVEGYALGRSAQLIYRQLPEGAEHKVIAMVDIGAKMITVAVVDAGETVFVREQAFGGEQYTQSILSFYGMSYDKAEKAKIDGELPRNYTFEVLSPFQTQLIQQIRRTLQIYRTSGERDNVDYVVLCGGTSLIDGLAPLISSELGSLTVVANPFQSELSADARVESALGRDISRYMVACGLALRSCSPWQI